MNWMHQICIFQDIEDFFAITRKLMIIHLPLCHFGKAFPVSIRSKNTNRYILTCIELNRDYPDILNLCLNWSSCLLAPKCFLPIVARRLIWALIIRVLLLFFSFTDFSLRQNADVYKWMLRLSPSVTRKCSFRIKH